MLPASFSFALIFYEKTDEKLLFLKEYKRVNRR